MTGTENLIVSNMTMSTTTGFANMITDTVNSTNVTDTVSELEPEVNAFLKKLFDILLIVLVCIVMASLGCTITLKTLKAQLRRPVGIIIGLVCQFIIFPAITFGLAHALKLEKWNAIGMIILGSCPGGSVSNILTYYCDGDVTLSVSMTAMSTAVGIGMMPLNSWIYLRSWADHKTVIPIKSIMIGLASLLVPVTIGMIIRVKLPRMAVWITRIGSALGLLMIFTVIGITSYLYPQMYSSPWQLWLASALLPGLGLTFGYTASSIFCLPQASRRAIAIETGCQNVALCLTLVSISYGADVFLKVMVFPALFGGVSLAIILGLVGLYQIQKIVRRRLGLNGKELEKNNETKSVKSTKNADEEQSESATGYEGKSQKF